MGLSLAYLIGFFKPLNGARYRKLEGRFEISRLGFVDLCPALDHSPFLQFGPVLRPPVLCAVTLRTFARTIVTPQVV